MEGIKVKKLKKFVDDRGVFVELSREDWVDLFDGEPIMQWNYTFGYPGVVRAWHRHLLGQVDYFVVLGGALKIVAYDGDEKSDTYGHVFEMILSRENMGIIRIPGKYWHGNMVVSNDPVVFIYGISKLYNHLTPDEERLEWDSFKIVPRKINGKTSDPRIGEIWDWNRPRNK